MIVKWLCRAVFVLSLPAPFVFYDYSGYIFVLSAVLMLIYIEVLVRRGVI